MFTCDTYNIIIEQRPTSSTIVFSFDYNTMCKKIAHSTMHSLHPASLYNYLGAADNMLKTTLWAPKAVRHPRGVIVMIQDRVKV